MFSDTNSTRSHSHHSQQKSNDSHHSYGYHDANNMEKGCLSVESCKAIKRLIIALKWYATCNGNYQGLLHKIKESTYDKYIIDDYQHVLNHHLIQKDVTNSSQEFELIQIEINKHLEPCDISTCSGYLRYNEVSKKNLSKSLNHELSMDFMDLIHCYLMHLDHLQ